ncbi:Hypothetical predicted protein [Paramuricea clavata]|uniref:Uncharacterized protein n=1 Tax=Paramuricea clavata TaxID=317549 RepID=A0A7D9HLJ9_PARCT|nr:Hypothetical predicted protein [Paramuricea clavata]
MGESYNSKIQVWKNTIEQNRSTVEFLQKVKEKQVKDCNSDDMDIDTQLDLTDNVVNTYSSYTPEVLQQATKLILKIQVSRNETGLTDENLKDVIKHLESEKLPLYKIVGDNVDLEVHARIQTKDHGNKSLHWTHQFAERARIVSSIPTKQTHQKGLKMSSWLNYCHLPLC